MPKIILASTSPRRKKLLQQLGLKFKVVPSRFQEDMSLKLDPRQLVKQFARGKAQNVAKKYETGIVIGADTVISLGNQVLGKPQTATKARQTLQQISGRTLAIITGYCLIDCSNGRTITKSVTTQVKIKKLSSQEIDAYVKTKEPLDKAGAFGIQGLGALLVRKIEGDYFNVVGLPLYNLNQDLKKMGVKVL